MTSLRGNLSIVDLANILQMLQMNQREGTLHIVGPEGRKAVYFGLDGVSTLNCGQKRQATIGRILVRSGLVTEEQLADALRRQSQSSGRMLGQIVVEQGLVTREQVEEALRTQVEEEIYDLFITKDAQFEFLEGELPEDLAALRSQNRIAFNVNTLIMEAAQRIDEWEWIQTVVPDPRESYRRSGVNVPLEHPLFSEPAGGRILTSIDGRRNVDELIEDSYAGKFQVYKAVALLVKAGALEPVEAADLRMEAERAVADGDTAATIKFLSRLVDLGKEDAGSHLSLAEAFESERELERAAYHYRVYAETRVEALDVREAFRVYQRIFEILPTDLAAGDRMVEVFSMNPDGLEDCGRHVIDCGKTLAEVYVELGRSSRAIQILHRVVSLGPDDADLRSRLIDVYLQTGMSGEAVAEYEALAEVALAQQEHDRAEQIYRKILTITPERDDVLTRLNQLISRKTRRRRSVRNSIAAAGVATVLGVAAWYGAELWLDHRASVVRSNAHAATAVTDIRQRHQGLAVELSKLLSDLASSTGSEETLLHQISGRQDERPALEARANSAIRELNDAVKEYAGTPAADDAAEAASALKHQVREITRATADGVERLAARAQALYVEGRDLANTGAPTRVLYERFARAMTVGAPCTAWLRTKDGTECQAFHASLRETLEGLAAANMEIVALVADRKLDAAFDRAIRFLETYPPPDIAGELRVPIVIDSIPTGARLRVPGDDEERTTPAPVLVGIRERTVIELRHPGFAPGEARIEPVESIEPRAIVARLPRRVTTALSREVRFVSEPVSGRLQAPAERYGDLLVVPTRSERVEVFDAAGALRLAPFVLRNPSGSHVRVVRDGDVLAVFGTDGIVSLHDFGSRRFLGAHEVPGEIRAEPVAIPGGVAIPTVDGHVVALDISERRELWRYPARGTAAVPGGLRGAPLLVEGELFVVDGRGDVTVLDAATGAVLRTVALRTLDRRLDPEHGVAVDTGHVAAVDARGFVTKLDHRTGAVAWSVSIVCSPAFRPLLLDGRVLVVGTDGRLFLLDAKNGSIACELALGAEPVSAPQVDGDVLLIGDRKERITAVQFDGNALRVAWRHEVGPEGRRPAISTPPTVRGDLLVFGTDDGRLHAVSR